MRVGQSVSFIGACFTLPNRCHADPMLSGRERERLCFRAVGLGFERHMRGNLAFPCPSEECLRPARLHSWYGRHKRETRIGNVGTGLSSMHEANSSTAERTHHKTRPRARRCHRHEERE